MEGPSASIELERRDQLSHSPSQSSTVHPAQVVEIEAERRRTRCSGDSVQLARLVITLASIEKPPIGLPTGKDAVQLTKGQNHIVASELGAIARFPMPDVSSSDLWTRGKCATCDFVMYIPYGND